MWFLLGPSSCFLISLFTPLMAKVLGVLSRYKWLGANPPLFLPLAQRLRVAKSRRASLCPAYPTLTYQDVNLKMPRNNQLLHFAFREDKQWKLQQVTRPFPNQSHKDRQGQACTVVLRPPGLDTGDLQPQQAW